MFNIVYIKQNVYQNNMTEQLICIHKYILS